MFYIKIILYICVIINQNKTKMKKDLSLQKIIDQLEIWIDDCQFDLKSDWIDEQDKIEMREQLQNLIISKSNLELIMNGGKQIFNSVINKG